MVIGLFNGKLVGYAHFLRQKQQCSQTFLNFRDENTVCSGPLVFDLTTRKGLGWLPYNMNQNRWRWWRGTFWLTQNKLILYVKFIFHFVKNVDFGYFFRLSQLLPPPPIYCSIGTKGKMFWFEIVILRTPYSVFGNLHFWVTRCKECCFTTARARKYPCRRKELQNDASAERGLVYC